MKLISIFILSLGLLTSGICEQIAPEQTVKGAIVESQKNNLTGVLTIVNLVDVAAHEKGALQPLALIRLFNSIDLEAVKFAESRYTMGDELIEIKMIAPVFLSFDLRRTPTEPRTKPRFTYRISAVRKEQAKREQDGTLQPETAPAEERSVGSIGILAPEVDLDQFEDKELYKCVLGTYGRYAREARYPIANLSVPNRDLWSKSIQSRLRGCIEAYKLNYRGDAKLVIPEDGIYTLDIPGRGTGFQVNGVILKRGDVELTKGVYKVQITTGMHGQPYLPDCFARIFRKGKDQELPLVNTGADIKEFLSTAIDDHPVIEVSGHRPELIEPALLDR